MLCKRSGNVVVLHFSNFCDIDYLWLCVWLERLLLGTTKLRGSVQIRIVYVRSISFESNGPIRYFYKKAVLSQRWPRDARYISRSWAVAEIWPFEIIQDGGGRHLEFIRIENSAIRSAVLENPHPITKHEVDRTTGCGDIATWNFSNMAVAAILDLFES